MKKLHLSKIKTSLKIKPRTWFFVGIIVLLAPVVILTLFAPKGSEASWFDMGYSFRKLVPVANSSGEDQTDFQVEITLDTATLVTDSKMQSDCDDLRITDINGNLLPHWVEPNTCNTTKTLVWVKVPTVHTSGTDLYVYYGNPSAAAAASGTDNVFIRDMESAVAAWPMDETDTNQSYARVLGPTVSEGRNIVVNGTFDTDTDWTKDTGATISGGVATFSGVASEAGIYQTAPITVGKSYEITFTVSGFSSGGVRPAMGSGTYGTLRTADGTYTETLTAAGTAVVKIIAGGSGFTGNIDNVSVKQVNIPSSADIDGSELLTDGDMEAADTSAWTPRVSGLLSKQSPINPPQGSQVIRVSYGGGNNPTASQSILVSGKTYRATGYARGDNTIGWPTIYANGIKWEGTTSSSWQHFDITFVATGSIFDLMLRASSSAYAEFDNVSVTEISPLSGSIPVAGDTNRPTVNTASGGHLTNAYSFDGSNDYVNIYSSDLNSVFNPDEGTLVAWVKVSDVGDWSDSNYRRVAYLAASGTNLIAMSKTSSTNQVQLSYYAGGVLSTVVTTLPSPTEYVLFTLSWSKSSDQVKAYINGVQIGTTQTSLGTWEGNLANTTTTIGSSNTSGNNPWKGLINDVRLYNRALSPGEIASLYNASSDIQAYYTENYSGHELIRKYNTGVTTGTYGDEEVGPGPVAYWKFDDGQGQSAQDSTNNNNDGTIVNAQWQTEDKCISGKCLYFDGSGDYVTKSDTSTLSWDTNSPNKTISTWFKTTSTASDQFIVAKRDSWSSGEYLLRVQGNKLNGVLWANDSSSNSLTCNTTLSLDTWYHAEYSIQQDGGNWIQNIYLNGVLCNSRTDAGSISTNTNNTLNIGNIAFTGFIDEVKIYPYARSAAQVKEDFNMGATKLGLADQGTLSDGLVGYWSMDESSGTTVADKSGNGNTGTLTNAQESGTSDASGNTTTTMVDTDGATLSTTDDAYNGMILRFTAACGSITSGTERVISDYTGATKTFTVGTALATAPNSCAYEVRHQVGGKFGNGVGFDGENDYASIADNSNLNLTSSFTYAGWIYWDSDASGNDVIYDSGTGTNNWYVIILTNKLTFTESGIADYTSNTSITKNTWHHVAIVKDGDSEDNVKFYVDGSIDGTASVGTVVTPSGAKYIGASNGSTLSWRGKQDETRIYNRALSPSEVKQLYEWAPGPVGYWDFEEGSGDTAFDRSGNGNNGNITGATYTQGKYGKALSFDGVDDYVDIYSSKLANDLNASEGTIAVWAKANDSVVWSDDTRRTILNLRTSSGINILTIRKDNDNQLEWYYKTSATTIKKTTASTDFMFLVLTWSQDRNEVKAYLNGFQEGSTLSFPGVIEGSLDSTQAAIGATTNSGSNPWAGQIDEVKIYNYARTVEQIRQDMEGQSTGGPGDPLPSPVAHWSFDEGQGQIAHNSSKYSVDGSLDGTLGISSEVNTEDPAWSTLGKIGRALDFTASESDQSYATVTTDLLTQQFSYSAWVNAESFTTLGGVVSHFSDGGGKLYVTSTSASSSTISYGFRDSPGNYTTCTSNSALSTGSWYHLGVTYNRGKVKMYINGKLDKECSGDTELSNIEGFIVGHNGDNNVSFDGLIDEVKIYNSALSAEQVMLDYNSGKSLNFGGSDEAADMTDGAGDPPIAYWDFEEASGTSLVSDKSGNGVDLTMNGSMTDENWVLGKIGKGLDFDDTDDTLSNATPPIFMDDSFSISAWIKPDDLADDQGIFNEGSPWISNTKGFSISYRSTGILFTRLNNGTNAYTDASTTIGDITGDWHHLAVVVNNDTSLTYYLDGKDIGSHNISAQAGSYDNGTLYLGRYASGINFDGQIDEVKIYNYARTPAQIAYDYNRGAPTARWRFDECEGTTIHDASGNGNNGTLVIGSGGEDTVGTCNTSSTAWGSGASGKYGASMSFDGGDDYVDMGDITSFNYSSSSNFTIGAWVSVSSTSENGYILSKASIGDRGYGLYWQGSTDSIVLTSGVNTIGYASSPIFTESNSWVHVTAVFSNGTVNYYKNGASAGSVSGYNFSAATSAENLLVGNRTGGSATATFFNGKIDDVQIYNYALSSAQVKKLYNENSAIRFGPNEGN